MWTKTRMGGITMDNEVLQALETIQKCGMEKNIQVEVFLKRLPIYLEMFLSMD